MGTVNVRKRGKTYQYYFEGAPINGKRKQISKAGFRTKNEAQEEGNIAYRNWNKSAYSYNEKKKRFEFKEDLGRSFDVPKYIKVEVL